MGGLQKNAHVLFSLFYEKDSARTRTLHHIPGSGTVRLAFRGLVRYQRTDPSTLIVLDRFSRPGEKHPVNAPLRSPEFTYGCDHKFPLCDNLLPEYARVSYMLGHCRSMT